MKHSTFSSSLLSWQPVLHGSARMDTCRHTNTFIQAHTGKGLILLPVARFQYDLVGSAEGDSLEKMLASFVPELI